MNDFLSLATELVTSILLELDDFRDVLRCRQVRPRVGYNFTRQSSLAELTNTSS